MNRRKTASPRGVLKTAAADPQRYRHARYHPSPGLEPYVEHYWSVQWDLRGLAPERVETLPHPSVHLIFEPKVGGRIAGVAKGKFSRVLEGQGSVLAAKFRPGGFHPFVRVPLSRFTDTVATVGDVFGAKGEAFERAVFAERDDASRIAVVESFLRDCRPAPDEHVSLVAKIVYAAAEDREILKVEDLVDRYAINQRTLQRLFAKYVGVSPKWVIQRYRLHEAAEQLASGGRDLAGGVCQGGPTGATLTLEAKLDEHVSGVIRAKPSRAAPYCRRTGQGSRPGFRVGGQP